MRLTSSATSCKDSNRLIPSSYKRPLLYMILSSNPSKAVSTQGWKFSTEIYLFTSGGMLTDTALTIALVGNRIRKQHALACRSSILQFCLSRSLMIMGIAFLAYILQVAISLINRSMVKKRSGG